MGMGRLIVGGLGAYALLTMVPSAQMEAKEPGSSVEYRQANATAVHAGMESATLAVQDGLEQAGPLLQSLLLQFQTGIAPLAGPAPAATGTTLPTPVDPK